LPFGLLLFLVALVVESQLAQSQTRQLPGTKWALLVGIDEYEHDITPLRFAVTDVKAVAAALVESLAFPMENVLVMTSDVKSGLNRPDNANVIQRLDFLARRVGKNDTFLFYFSGHGFQRENGRHFLGTVNARLSSIELLQITSLSMELLREKMSKVQAQRIVFMIDACRTDPEQGKSDKDNPLTDDFTRSLQVVARAGGAGVAGTAVFYACSKGERSYEWPEKQHGVFTYYLLEGLRGKAADANGELSITGLGKFVQKQVLDWSDQHQKEQRPFLVQEGAADIVLGTSVTPGGGIVVDTKAHLLVRTTPPGARVFVDQKEVQNLVTPMTLRWDLGRNRTAEVELACELPGYLQAVRLMTLERGRTLTLDVPLQRREAAAPVSRRLTEVKRLAVFVDDNTKDKSGTAAILDELRKLQRFDAVIDAMKANAALTKSLINKERCYDPQAVAALCAVTGAEALLHVVVRARGANAIFSTTWQATAETVIVSAATDELWREGTDTNKNFFYTGNTWQDATRRAAANLSRKLKERLQKPDGK